MKKVYVLLLALFTVANVFATTYYYKGSGVLTVATNWNTARDGLGTDASTAPTTASAHIYIIQGTADAGGVPTGVSAQSVTVSVAFTVAAGVTIEVEGGATLTTTTAVTFNSTGIFKLDNGSTYKHQNAAAYGSTIFAGIENFAANSTVELNNSNTTGPANVVFGNLLVNFTADPGGAVSLAGAITTINGNLTVTATLAREFRLTATATYTLNIAGSLIVNGGFLVLTSSSGVATVNVAGDVNVSSGTLQYCSSSSGIATLSANGTVSGTTGTFSLSGGLVTSLSSAIHTLNLSGDMLVSGGTYNMCTSGAAGPLCTINVNGTVAPSTGKIALSGNGIITQASTSGIVITTKGDFTLTGTSSFKDGSSTSGSSGRAQVINIGGNLNVGAGTSFTASSTSSTTSSLNFVNAANPSVAFTNAGTCTLGEKDITVAVGKTLLLNNDFTNTHSTGLITVNGTLNCVTNKIAGTTGFTAASASTLKIGSPAGIASTAATGSIQSTGTRTFSTSANYEYNGAAAQVTGNQLPATVNKLTINNGAGVALTSGVIAGTLDLTSGKLTLGANNVTANTVTGGSSSNYVVTDAAGALKINAIGASNILFPVGPSITGYNPITVNNAGATDNFSVKVKPSFTNVPFDPTQVVNMEWLVSKDGSPTGNNVTLTPQWNVSDEAGSFNRAGSLVIGHYNALWDETAATLGGAGPTYTAAASGLTSFSPFGVGNAGAFYNATPANVALSSANPAVAASNVGQGTNKNIIYNFNLAVTVNAATLSSVDFTTGGTYITTDVSRFQLWYNSTNNFNTALQIGSDINSGLGSGAHSFAGLTQPLPNTATGYFWITTDVAASGVSVPGNVINVIALTTSDLNFVSATKSGTAFASDDQTIVAPTLTLSSANPAVPTGSLGQGAVKAPVYTFSIASANATAILNQINFTTGGSYVAADITRFQVWYNTTNNLGTALQLGADITTSLGSGTHTLGSLTQVIGSGVTGYIWVTADIDAAATINNTIDVAAITPGDLSFASGSVGGTTFAGGTLTIIVPTASSDDFRSKADGDWTVFNNWESAPFGSGLWHDATAFPTGAATSIRVRIGDTINITSAVTSTNTVIDNGGMINITTSGTLAFSPSKNLSIDGTLKQAGTLTMGTSVFMISATGIYENAVPSTTGTIAIPVPSGGWTAGSTCRITGVVGTAGGTPNDYNGTTGIGQAFSNFVVDVPNLVGKLVLTNQATLITAQFSATNLVVNSTGTSTYGMQLTSSGKQEIINVGTYTQNGGVVSIIHNSGNATSKALNVSGDLTLTGTSVFNVSAYTTTAATSALAVGGNLSMAPGATLQKNTSFGTGGTAAFTFNGGSAQTASFGITSGAVNYTINNGAGVTLTGGNLATTGALAFTSGKLSLGSSNVSANSVTGASSSNYVVTDGTGALTINNIAASTTVTFPVGPSTTSYNPAVLATNAGHVTDNISVRVSPNVLSGGTAGAPFTADWVDRGWNITEGTPGGSNVNLTLQWAGSQELSGFDRTNCTISHWDGTAWDDLSGAMAAGADPYTMVRNNVSSFSPFGVQKHQVVTPLTLLSFNATLNAGLAKIYWTTSNEINVQGYTIERSADGRNFSAAGTVAAINSGGTNAYSFNDPSAINGVIYYRLKMTDRDGKYKYSIIIAVSNNKAGNLGIFPNPVTDQLYAVHPKAKAGASVELYALDGRKVGQSAVVKDAVQSTIDTRELPKGVYQLVYVNDGKILFSRFVKQ